MAGNRHEFLIKERFRFILLQMHILVKVITRQSVSVVPSSADLAIFSGSVVLANASSAFGVAYVRMLVAIARYALREWLARNLSVFVSSLARFTILADVTFGLNWES